MHDSYIITRLRSFAEYYLLTYFVARFNDVYASGYNSAGSERIWMKFGVEYSEYIVWNWPWHWQILGAIRAEARAGERTEILFFFLT